MIAWPLLSGFSLLALAAAWGEGVGWPWLLALWLLALAALGVQFALQWSHNKDSHKLLEWLLKPALDAPPDLPGLWGETAYRALKALKQKESYAVQQEQRLARFLSALQAAPDGVILLDAEDRIDWFNSIAASYLGLNLRQDLWQNIFNLIREPEFRNALNKQLNAPIEEKSSGTVLTLRAHFGDTARKLLLQSYPFGSGYRLLLLRDVTALERAEQMRRDFVANISHEIKTPLAALSGLIDTLETLSPTEEDREHYLRLMREQTGRLATLLTDLLILAKLDSDQRSDSMKWYPLSGLLRELQNEAEQVSAGRHRLLFETQAAADWQICGDATELHSGLSNLIHNALRYTSEHGEIRVTWRMLENGTGEFSVQDSGIGIDAEHLPRITERFYRVDQARSKSSGGTGLGLSIVKHVALRHDALLNIESRPGIGSRFSLLFPAARLRQIG